MRSLDTQHTCPHIEAGEGGESCLVSDAVTCCWRLGLFAVYLLKLLDFIQKRAEGGAGGWFAGSGEQRVTLREEREREKVLRRWDKKPEVARVLSLLMDHYIDIVSPLAWQPDIICGLFRTWDMITGGCQWRGLNALIYQYTNKKPEKKLSSHLFNRSGFKSIYLCLKKYRFLFFFLQVIQTTYVPFYHLRRHPPRGVRPRQDVMQRNKLSNNWKTWRCKMHRN